MESKIRTACEVFPNTEWSGAAFYKYIKKVDSTTNMEETELMVVDLTLQDIGSTGYTEYSLDGDTAAYYADHINELLGCKIALLHSHNSMKCWFSNIDLPTLKEQAAQCNNVLSIIVNNAGEYVAKFTEKHSVHKDMAITTYTTETDKWKYMGEVEGNNQKSYDTTKGETDDYIEIKCWDCDIDRPLDVAIDEEFKKECIEKIDLFKKKKESPINTNSGVLTNVSDKIKYCEPYLFDDGWDYNDYNKMRESYNINDMVNSIFQLSFSPTYSSAYWFKDLLDDKYSDEFYYAFLDAWMEFYNPNAEQLEKVIDRINLKTDYKNYEAIRSVDTITDYLTNILEGYLDEELTKKENEQRK